jgi:small subunit ribosomal protein S19
MAERIAFRGRFQSDLTDLKFEDYLKMVKSRQRRTIKRQGNDYKRLIQKVERYKSKGLDKPVKTHIREAVILPSWIGMKFAVYSGKTFEPMVITANMLGHRLGEFVFTTKRVLHSAPGIRATKGSKFLAQK